jgi:plasmid maintenance system antidote protein VapI
MSKLLDEIHPGEILLEDFMRPMGITADTAIRLGLFFRMDPKFWLYLQMEYDIRVAKRTLQKEIEPRIRVF